ncbi:MAG: 6-carboxytetrahydropterin synthase [Planctomycetaceae bacterium]|jgi:6-pyruvoyltetrahydropterin/6-carboxytetrahydropterin synthase|nr:6-carboxytetrahydropterin synthase [Planctomycetaceae bacterium]
MKKWVCSKCGYAYDGENAPAQCPVCHVPTSEFKEKTTNEEKRILTSITKLNIQYAHRFWGYIGEAQYLHGHTGTLTLEVEGEVNNTNGFVVACNSIKNHAWEYLVNFDHATILQKEDPILPELLKVYQTQGIKDGSKWNSSVGIAFDTDLAKAYPECRLVVVKKVATVENLIEIFYSLLKNTLNIKKLTFTSGDNAASFNVK